MSYALFTVSHCCIDHYVDNYYVNIINRLFDRLFRQTNEFAKYVLHRNIMYLKASADVNISTFFGEKWGDEAVHHKMDFYNKLTTRCEFPDNALGTSHNALPQYVMTLMD